MSYFARSRLSVPALAVALVLTVQAAAQTTTTPILAPRVSTLVDRKPAPLAPAKAQVSMVIPLLVNSPNNTFTVQVLGNRIDVQGGYVITPASLMQVNVIPHSPTAFDNNIVTVRLMGRESGGIGAVTIALHANPAVRSVCRTTGIQNAPFNCALAAPVGALESIQAFDVSTDVYTMPFLSVDVL